MHELAMLPFFGSISDVTWHFFSPVQWLKSGGWAENTWAYRLTSNSNTALPRPTKPDSLYLDLPTKSSQFGTCRPTKLDKIKNLFHHLHFGSVTGHSLCSAGGNGRRETNSQSKDGVSKGSRWRSGGFCFERAADGTNYPEPTEPQQDARRLRSWRLRLRRLPPGHPVADARLGEDAPGAVRILSQLLPHPAQL